MLGMPGLQCCMDIMGWQSLPRHHLSMPAHGCSDEHRLILKMRACCGLHSRNLLIINIPHCSILQTLAR